MTVDPIRTSWLPLFLVAIAVSGPLASSAQERTPDLVELERIARGELVDRLGDDLARPPPGGPVLAERVVPGVAGQLEPDVPPAVEVERAPRVGVVAVVLVLRECGSRQESHQEPHRRQCGR